MLERERRVIFLISLGGGEMHPRTSMNYSSAVETEEDPKPQPKPSWKARAPLFIYLVLPVELRVRQEKATFLMNEVKTHPLVSDITLVQRAPSFDNER